jgi:hypothetical protein
MKNVLGGILGMTIMNGIMHTSLKYLVVDYRKD